MKADIQPVMQDYGISRWGGGYFGINPDGHVTVRPDRKGDAQIDLYQLASEVRQSGLSLPVLVRFTDILHDRVAALCSSFSEAFEEFSYQGRYTAVYPVKVNQQRSVVEEILAKGRGCVGLEAGSKPELMAVLGQSLPGGVIVCNGYKDREYVRLALIGLRLGHRVYIVIEKLSELAMVLQESRDLGVEPLLGVRIRVSVAAVGNWQDSGGEKAKFGLTAGQLLALVEQLKSEDKLDRLQLLHSHIGSQIPNLRDIRQCMDEVARFYGELRLLGADIQVVDVGGGLGVDYEGTATRHFCSMNYGPGAYAREVVKALSRICDEQALPCPDIFSESGRALTAHHAMLMVNVIDFELAPAGIDEIELDADVPEVLNTMKHQLETAAIHSPSEVYQEAEHGLGEARELFHHGELSLEQRSMVEGLFYGVCRKLIPRLRAESRRDRELLDTLREKLADRLFMNFSLFQSLPDVWAIDQIFPVMPLHRLNEQPMRSGVLHDLTCDSDGYIGQYVDRDGIESTLPVHELTPGEPYLMGIFLVGAYQEILGDMHNLFGDADAVNLELDGKGGYRLTQSERGDSVDELLRYVHFAPERLLANYKRKLADAGVGRDESQALFRELEAGLHGYTYFED
ncbi:biosynthetic arginine decarboxylase [Solemya velesiana gill symbiont]|uniref:Biosynthetic arginine decarboxylase n=1 Tax=Solemya velesiana gill symbiont TaxID=1918948 RepID=A0A1T2KU59_9GAMM|nr:biosynthetic arginine decarboxylase [Solemya velesiana gill symbiont]OOZ36387.1 arginine decarboxylase [Solemya velesiana gill symbiont]